MLKVYGFTEKDRRFKATYIQNGSVFNIESDDMTDDCRGYDESIACMVWLDSNNTLFELEKIGCLRMDNDRDFRIKNLPNITGFPVLEVTYSNSSYYLFSERNDYILFFDLNKEPDLKCVQNDIVYYLNKNKIIAIECKNTIIELK